MSRGVDQEVRQCFELLVESGRVTRGSLRGCSAAEVARLEERIGSRLPTAYVTLLRGGGWSLGGFLVGSDLAYDELSGIDEGARELLAEYGLELPQSAFVYYMHGGYQFNFFSLDEGDDPQIYGFAEVALGRPAIKPLGLVFTGWLRAYVDYEIRLRDE